MMYEDGQWHMKNIYIHPGSTFCCQLTCWYMTLGMRSLLDLQLFSSSLFLPFQYFLTSHFFSWPSKHCKLCIGNIWFWLFYFITKFEMYKNCSHNYDENKQTKRFMNKLLASLFKGLISREAIQKLMLNSLKLKIVLSGHRVFSVFRRVPWF